MRKSIRVLLAIVLGCAALFVVASLVLYVVFPREEILARVRSEAETRLGREVTLADAGVSFWPPFGVFIQGLEIQNAPGAIQSRLVSVGYARAHLRLWPLFARQVVLDEVELRDVVFAFERFDSLSTNLTDLLAGEGGIAPFLVEHLRWERLTVHYDDRTDGTHFRLEELSARCTVDATSGAFTAELQLPGWIWARQADTVHSQDPVSIAARGRYDQDADLLAVDDLTGSVAGVPLTGSVQVGSFLAEPAPALQLDIGPVELSDLMQRLPPSRRAAMEPYNPAGLIQGRLSWRGADHPTVLAGATGELTWLDGRLEMNGVEVFRCASLAIPFDSSGFHVTGVDVRAFEEPLQLALLGRWQPQMTVEAKLSGRLRLERVAELLATEGWTGGCTYAFTGSGPAWKPERWSLRIRLEAENITYAEPARDPWRLLTGTVEFDGSSLAARDLNIEAGRSRLEVSANVVDLPPWTRLWSQDTSERVFVPRASARIRGPLLDLDALFPGLAGDSAAPADTGATPPPVSMPAHVDLAMDTLIMGGAAWRDVQGALRLVPPVLWVDTLTGRVHQGHAALNGQIDFARPDTPVYAFAIRVDSVEVGESLLRFSPAGRHVRGRGNLAADLRGHGTEPAQIVSDLFATGRVELYDARLEGLESGSAILSFLGLSPRDPIPLASRWNQFKLEAGKVRVDDFEFQALKSQWRISGDAGLDGSLAYTLDVRLSPELSAQFKLPQAMSAIIPGVEGVGFDPLDLLKDDQGQVELYLRLGGYARKPDVQFDLDRLQPVMQKRFEQRVAATLKQDLKDEVQKGLKSLFDKRKP